MLETKNKKNARTRPTGNTNQRVCVAVDVYDASASVFDEIYHARDEVLDR